MAERYLFSEETESKVKQAVESVFETEVLSSLRMIKGEVNYVFKVETSDKNLVARVFSIPGFPKDGQLEWINNQLKANNVPHAELIYDSRDNKFFPYGFMVSEFIEGENGHEAIKKGFISMEELHQKVGVLLKRVHSVKLGHYGDILDDEDNTKSVREYYLRKTKRALSKLENPDQSLVDLYTQAEEEIGSLLKPFETTFKPVLVHKDASPDNSILTPSGDIVLVDWDSAISSIWIADLAIITYSGSHLSDQGKLEDRRNRIRESFLKGYGSIEYSMEELLKIEKALHIVRACELLPYYATFQNNADAYNATLDYLNKLLI